MQQQEFIGAKSIIKLPALLKEINIRSVFLLHGKSSFRTTGLDQQIRNLLKPQLLGEWSDFGNNPKLEDLVKARTAFRNSGYDCIISVGGGSVIDMAKLLKYFAITEDPAELLHENRLPEQFRSIPHIAIPTTAGSGSESTHFAVIYVDRVKHSIADEHILPEVAVVDPELTYSLPKRQTAISGMDAFSQAIESYWSINSSEESRKYASDAISTIIRNLPTAVKSPTPEVREKMIRAAHLAGKAINISKTTAPHAISYTLTSCFDIPHGHAVSITLGEVFFYNAGTSTADIVDPRGIGFVRDRMSELNDLLGSNSADASREIIRNLMTEIGLETRLDHLGIRTPEDIDLILNGVNLQRLQNNPRCLSQEALKEILYRLTGISTDLSNNEM